MATIVKEASQGPPHWAQSVLQAAAIHRKDPNLTYYYGTAGFRLNAALMGPVSFRVGLLAAILSASNACKYSGIMITASHNPEEDNGIKLIDADGTVPLFKWEAAATRLANCPEEAIVDELVAIIASEGLTVDLSKARVLLARDTRKSGPELSDAVMAGVAAIGATATDCGVQTTPEHHYAVWAANTLPKPDLASMRKVYINNFSEAFENLLGEGTKCIPGTLVIDAANGVGAKMTLDFVERLSHCLPAVSIINNGDGVLNEKCGADYVKMHVTPPNGAKPSMGTRFASLDGDADRLLYYYFDQDEQFHLLDGDRIAVLYALFIKDLLSASDIDCSVGVVQTAYANGGSTRFLKSKGVAVVWACTGVKNMHREAQKFDIGIYFEANGHGTALFDPAFMEKVHMNIAKTESGEKKASLVKLTLVAKLINQCVGDALSDLLLVEAILAINAWTSMSTWDGLYTELPSCQIKIPVDNREAYVTANADTVLVEPAGIQVRIDAIVEQCAGGRAFLRPSGTENILRVYAEAETQELADKLAHDVAAISKI